VSFGGRWEAFFTVPSGSSVAATNSGGTGTSVSLTAGDYTPTSFLTHLVARLNAVRTPATWTGTLSTGASGTGLVTLDCVGETYAIAFTTAAAGTILGFSGNISSTSDAAVGTQNARGLWLPKCPAVFAFDPRRAPERTDLITVVGPTARSTSYLSNIHYRHNEIAYSHVLSSRIWTGEEATTYASLQSWLRDTQWSEGHDWFSVGSSFQMYWDNAGTDVIVGYDRNSGSGPSDGWTFDPPIASIESVVRNANAPRLAYWSVAIPSIVSEG
jgi:hypothetical protein